MRQLELALKAAGVPTASSFPRRRSGNGGRQACGGHVKRRSRTFTSRVRRLAAPLLATIAAASFRCGQAESAKPVAPGVGRVAEYRVASREYRRERRVWVYTPPGYAAKDSVSHDLLVA